MLTLLLNESKCDNSKLGKLESNYISEATPIIIKELWEIPVLFTGGWHNNFPYD